MRRGDILPFPAAVRVPRSSNVITALLVGCSMITSSTFGYDGSMMNGLNILPQYNDYFKLNTTTTALNTSTLYLGGCIAGFVWGAVTDAIGRRPSLFWAAVLTIIAVILQTAAQNVGMFIFARVLIGFGTTASAVTGPAYLAETLPWRSRAWGLGIFNDFYYVGGLVAAGVTFGTADMGGSWSWRLPSLIQGVFSMGCIIILPFLPESPRWLVSQGRREEALTSLAQANARGDETNELVLLQYREICDTLDFERQDEAQLGLKQILRNKGARKRLIIAGTCAFFSTLAGNIIASYYLGTMLDNAGITNTTTQLQINIILNAWCLVISVIGTLYTDKIGIKATALASTAVMTVAIFLVGALTDLYGTSNYTPGVYATVAMIFIFMGAYSFGWTPLLYLVPAEVLNYRIRANGMSFFGFVLNATALWGVFAFPFALEGIGWKTYMINGTWDVFVFGFIWWYWVEIKGMTLEEIDEVMDGVKHSDVPDVEVVEKGDVQSKEVEM
ncbi:MFS sugar transporter-like protein [Coniochaeta hoffmannii]|uniref:MFS sugar transporter-like protein n=1 Tax=Coniochaeta hoffmannii TaxID=91930 RepID=A0AA38RXX6_9PEZI|nr:MFS sugar transporter-like protein [Coniochaeta hoffmannii]